MKPRDPLTPVCNKVFGEALRKARAKSGMTIREVEFATRISSQAVNQYELGHQGPTLRIAIRLANYFGFSLDSVAKGLKNK